MFKIFFILAALITSVSVSEIQVVASNDLSFTEVNILEIENLDNVDFDNTALLSQTTADLNSYTDMKSSYLGPVVVAPTFQNFHSRAPPTFTS